MIRPYVFVVLADLKPAQFWGVMQCRLVVGLLTFPGNLPTPYLRSSLTF